MTWHKSDASVRFCARFQEWKFDEFRICLPHPTRCQHYEQTANQQWKFCRNRLGACWTRSAGERASENPILFSSTHKIWIPKWTGFNQTPDPRFIIAMIPLNSNGHGARRFRINYPRNFGRKKEITAEKLNSAHHPSDATSDKLLQHQDSTTTRQAFISSQIQHSQSLRPCLWTCMMLKTTGIKFFKRVSVLTTREQQPTLTRVPLLLRLQPNYFQQYWEADRNFPRTVSQQNDVQSGH